MGKILLLFFLIIVVMVSAALLRLRGREGRLSRGTILQLLGTTKYIRFSIALLALVFAGVFTWVYQKEQMSSASVQITMNYAEASKGQNANGVRYNMWEIIS